MTKFTFDYGCTAAYDGKFVASIHITMDGMAPTHGFEQLLAIVRKLNVEYAQQNEEAARGGEQQNSAEGK